MWIGEEGKRTEAEVDGQVKCELEEEGIVKEGDAKPGCVETTGNKHRSHIEVGKYAVEKAVDAFQMIPCLYASLTAIFVCQPDIREHFKGTRKRSILCLYDGHVTCLYASLTAV